MKKSKPKRKPRQNWKVLYLELKGHSDELDGMYDRLLNIHTRYEAATHLLCDSLLSAHARTEKVEQRTDFLIARNGDLEHQIKYLEDDVLRQSQKLAELRAIKHSCHNCGQTHGAECHAKEARG